MRRFENGYKFTIYDWMNDPNSKLNRVCCPFTIVRDRFNALNKYSPIIFTEETQPPLNQNSAIDMDFSDLIDIHASEYVALNKSLCVSFGGLDSYLVAIALLKNGLPPKSLKLIGTYGSINDFPMFYHLLKKMGCEFHISNNYQEDIKKVDYDILLTGDYIGLFAGYCAYTDRFDALHLKEDWRTSFLRKFDRAENDIPLIEEYIKASGLDCKTWGQLVMMYCAYSSGYEIVTSEYDHITYGTKNFGKYVGFLDTDLGMRYSIHKYTELADKSFNINEKLSNVSLYKREIKDYISDFLKDDSVYAVYKTRRISPTLKFSNLSIKCDNGEFKHFDTDGLSLEDFKKKKAEMLYEFVKPQYREFLNYARDNK